VTTRLTSASLRGKRSCVSSAFEGIDGLLDSVTLVSLWLWAFSQIGALSRNSSKLLSIRFGTPKPLSRALNLREQLATSLNGLPQEMEQYQPFAENRFCLFPQPFHLAYVAIFFHGSVFTLTKSPVNELAALNKESPALHGVFWGRAGTAHDSSRTDASETDRRELQQLACSQATKRGFFYSYVSRSESYVLGRKIVNTLPVLPGLVLLRMRSTPSCSLTVFFTSESPSPVPA